MAKRDPKDKQDDTRKNSDIDPYPTDPYFTDLFDKLFPPKFFDPTWRLTETYANPKYKLGVDMAKVQKNLDPKIDTAPDEQNRDLNTQRRGEIVAEFESKLKNRIIGQPEAIAALVKAYQKFLIGFNPPNRPITNLLFAGSTGVGKTKTCEALCDALFDNPYAMTKIDCAEYQYGHEIAKLTGCFVPGTAVLMADGSRKPIEDIRTGDTVISKNGSIQYVLDTYEYAADGEIVELKISGNPMPIRVTANHNIWALRGRGRKRPTTKAGRDRASLYDASKLAYIAAGDLQAGDIVTYPRLRRDTSKYAPTLDISNWLDTAKHPFLKITDTAIVSVNGEIPRFIKVSDIARIAGYYVSEGGTINKNAEYFTGVHFTLGLSKADALDDLMACIDTVFPNASIEFDTSRPNATRLNLYSTVLADFLKATCGNSPESKKIPEFLLHAPDTVLYSFLDAAFMGDGGRTISRRTDYSTVSATLASQTEMLLRSLGYTTQLHIDVPQNTDWQTRYRIYISGAQIDKFISNMRLLSTHVGTVNTGNGGIQRESYVDDSYIYFTIQDVRRVPYTGPVYDFSVSEQTSYVVQSVAVSNSPAGYLGHRETEALLAQHRIDKYQQGHVPLNVILFDEIEKANQSLWNLLLGILDKGIIGMGNAQETDMSKCIVLMTTNLGAKEMDRILSGKFIGFAQPHTENVATAADTAIRGTFTPEFMNRLDDVIIFRQLGKPELCRIFELEMANVQDRITFSKSCPLFVLTWTVAAMEYVIDKGYDSRYGARELKRAVENLVVNPLMTLLLDGKLRPTDALMLDLTDGELVFTSPY